MTTQRTSVIALLLAALWLTTLLAPPARADDIRLVADWSYLYSLLEVTQRDTVEKTMNRTDRFKQSYRLDLSKDLFPALTLNGGAQVEKNRQDNDLDGDDSIDRETVVMPYFDLEWRSAPFSLFGGYRERNVKRTGTTLIDTERDFLTSYNLRAEWRPLHLPRLDFSYLHARRDNDPETRNSSSDVYQLNSRYTYGKYDFLYSYLRNEEQNHLEDTGSVSNTHNARVRYADIYLDGKVNINAAMRAEYTDQTFEGTGIRDFPVFPTGTAFFQVDDDALPNNNFPEDYTSGSLDATLDLNTETILNIGLDFGEATEVDMLRLTLSAELDSGSAIVASNNWSVYVSDDQETWENRSVTSIDYQIDENRLDIRFTPTANHDYIMLVYTPPLPTNQVGEVRVTGIQALVSRALDDGSQLTARAHNAQFSLGWQATEKTRLVYNLNFQERRTSLFDTHRIRLNNAFNLIHHLSDTWIATGRVSANNTWLNSQHDASNYAYSAKLTARYLETLNQSLIYSGTWVDEQEGNGRSDSLILRTNAELYKGWDVAFDQGISWQTPTEGPKTNNYFVRIQNSLVPHRRLNLIAEYAMRWNQEENKSTERSDTGRVRMLWIPRDNISLSGELKLRGGDGDYDLFWEYGLNWLPLRDGSLQCSLNYNEEEDQDGFRTKSFSPNLTWDITDKISLTLRYSRGTRETASQESDFETAQVNLRARYD